MRRRRDFFRKTQHKRYSSRTFRNPYFQNQHDRTSFFILLGGGGAVALLIVAVLTLFIHPIFHLRRIHVSGLEHVMAVDVENELRDYFAKPVKFFFTRQNRFLFNRENLEETLREKFTLSELTVTQHSTSLEINLAERTSHLLWKTGQAQYVVDLEGVVIRIADASDAGLPLFIDRQNVEVMPGKIVLLPEEVVAVFKFHELLRTQQIAFTQTEFDRLEGKWTGVVTTDGYRILFDTAGDIEAQAKRFEVLKREQIKDVTKLQYVDLRFGDHVYFK